MAGLTIDERRRRLARLLVGFGANVQPGQTVMVGGDIDDRELVRAVANECYLAGAKFVELNYFDLHLKRARIEFGGDDSIGYATTWSYEQARAAAAECWAIISLSGGTDPSILAGLDPGRLGRDNSPVNTEWLKAVSERLVNWRSGWPSPVWAAVVHPDMEPDAALELLWSEVERVCRLDEEDAVSSWEQRMGAMAATADRITDHGFDALHFRGPGTDLEVGLLPSSRFVSGGAETAAGIPHRPNVPSEEAFTTPDPTRVNGEVRETRPLDVGGTVLTRAARRFQDGRAVVSTPTRAPTCCGPVPPSTTAACGSGRWRWSTARAGSGSSARCSTRHFWTRTRPVTSRSARASTTACQATTWGGSTPARSTSTS
jgi:aminopeptidase